MSKIKNGGLDQYGAEPFEQQQFGTAGVEGVKAYKLFYVDQRHFAYDKQSMTPVYRIHQGFIWPPHKGSNPPEKVYPQPSSVNSPLSKVVIIISHITMYRMQYVDLQWHIFKIGLVCYPLTLGSSSPGQKV